VAIQALPWKLEITFKINRLAKSNLKICFANVIKIPINAD
jgi:hypothetical protein